MFQKYPFRDGLKSAVRAGSAFPLAASVHSFGLQMNFKNHLRLLGTLAAEKCSAITCCISHSNLVQTKLPHFCFLTATWRERLFPQEEGRRFTLKPEKTEPVELCGFGDTREAGIAAAMRGREQLKTGDSSPWSEGVTE